MEVWGLRRIEGLCIAYRALIVPAEHNSTNPHVFVFYAFFRS